MKYIEQIFMLIKMVKLSTNERMRRKSGGTLTSLKKMQQEGVTEHSGMNAMVNKAAEYDVDELNEHFETVHNVKKTKYNLRKF